MITFKLDMQSEALKTLGRLASLPGKDIQGIGAVRAKWAVKKHYPGRWARSFAIGPFGGWQSFKQQFPGFGAVPGFFTGTTYRSITAQTSQAAGEVFLMGMWPRVSATETAGVAESDTKQIMAQLSAAAKDAFRTARDMGLDPSDVPAFDAIVPSYSRGEFHAKGQSGMDSIVVTAGGVRYRRDGIKRKIPAQPLSSIGYGESRGGMFPWGKSQPERTSSPLDFMYLNKKDVDDVFKATSRAAIRFIEGTRVAKFPSREVTTT